MTGPETMLRAFGLGPAIDEAKRLAENGTLGKLVEFVDNQERLIALMERIAHGQDALTEKLDAIHGLLERNEYPSASRNNSKSCFIAYNGSEAPTAGDGGSREASASIGDTS